MFEALMGVSSAPRFTGPGGQTLIVGNAVNGFYGEVPAADIFTSTQLATALSISSYGTMINDTVPWVKVSLDGRTFFTPLKALRHSLTWSVCDSMQIRTEAHNRRITKAGLTYRVTMMTGIGPTWVGAVGEDPAGCEGSQYNRIIYRLCELNPPREEPPSFGAYTLSQLGLTVNDPGCAMMTQEGSGGTHLQRNGGGGETGSNAWHGLQQYLTDNVTDQYRGWRPMLELVS